MKKKKLWLISSITGCVLLVSILVVILVSCSSQTFNMRDYITIEYTPEYDGYATPILSVDWEELDSLIDEEQMGNFINKLGRSEKSDFEDFLWNFDSAFTGSSPKLSDLVTVKLSEKYDNLANGDLIEVEIDISSFYSKFLTIEELEQGLDISFDEYTTVILVNGLKEFKNISVDLKELFDVNFGKYNGYATPSATIKFTYMDNLIIDELLNELKESVSSEARSLLSQPAYYWFEAQFAEQYNNLKNGDIIKVKLATTKELELSGVSLNTLENALKLNFNGGEESFVVTGLETPKNVIDIFEGIEQYISYDGANGTGYIGYDGFTIPDDYKKQMGDLYFSKYGVDSVRIVHNNRELGIIRYRVSGESLTKGDVLKITASCPTEELEALGYIVPTTTMYTTVPDLGEYLRTKDQLTPEVVAAIKAKICEERGIESIDRLYLGAFNPGVVCSYNSTLFIKVVFYKGGWFSGYYTDELYDIIIKPDGNIAVEEYIDDSWSDTSLEIAVEEFNNSENYSYTELD